MPEAIATQVPKEFVESLFAWALLASAWFAWANTPSFYTATSRRRLLICAAGSPPCRYKNTCCRPYGSTVRAIGRPWSPAELDHPGCDVLLEL